jgi:hypothetical protein
VPSIDTASLLEHALAYEPRGWALVPLKPRDKVPHVELLRAIYGKASWRFLSKTPATPDEIAKWVDYDPQLNLGVITGQASGVVVADFDAKAVGVRHPPTAIVATARGHHAYFASRGRVPTRRIPGGDLKADGGFIVAPPSIHPSGEEYTWLVPLAEQPLAPLAALVLPSPGQVDPPRPRGGYAGSSYGVPGVAVDVAARRRADVRSSELATDPNAVAAAAKVLGAKLERNFCCVLPGHEERRPSASLYRDPQTGVYKYRDWHRRDRRNWYSLAEVYAAQVSGQVRALSPPEASRWYDRLFHAAGLLEPRAIDLPPLPPGVAASVCRVADGFRLLVGLRWIHEPGEPTPFTRGFAKFWCAVGERQAGEAISVLTNAGVIERVGQHSRSRISLFMPGCVSGPMG